MSDKIEFITSSGNLFEDVGYEPQQAKKLQFKSYLMIALIQFIKTRNLTQTEVAKLMTVTQSRISNLVHLRAELFSIEILLDMMEKAGFRVYKKLEMNIDEFLNNPWPNQKISKQIKKRQRRN